MNRRKFIQNSAGVTASFFIAKDLFAVNKGPIYGHNNMKYTLDTKWGTLDSAKFPVNDCHEMVQDKKGRIILLTNETKNNILIYLFGLSNVHDHTRSCLVLFRSCS